MIVDARDLPRDFTISADVCIVGAGAAGIALAHELINSGLTIALIESGGLKVERQTQELYKGEVLDPARHGRLDLYRQRRFGGTTGVWGGRCAPLDDVDFEVRPYMPHSGWPFGKKDLDPYYERAHRYCDLGLYVYDVQKALPHSKNELVPGFVSSEVRTDQIWRFSLPTDFAKAFGATLRQADNVTVYLHTNCTKVCVPNSGTAISHLQLTSLSGNRFTSKAKRYVLAMGGLEVTRLLLHSSDVHKNGIGNSNGLLGRFYMSHITGDLGEIFFTPRGGRVLWDYEKSYDQVYCRRSISIAEHKQRSSHLFNFRGTLDHLPAFDPRHRNGILSSMYLAKRYVTHRVPPEYSRALSAIEPLRETASHLRNVLFDATNVVGFGSRWIRKRILSKRKLPSIALENKLNSYSLHFDGEQSPNPSSRLKLNDTIDVLGMRQLSVDWQCTAADIQSVVRSCWVILQALHRCKVGTMLFQPDHMYESIKRNCSVGSHHLGTTRMAACACHGVVDQNCRVHGIDNLYVASSSVFPTSGVANPTLTIVSLSIRLADHLRQIGGR